MATSGATGGAILDFGAAPGSTYASVDVTLQTGLVPASFCEAWLMGETTAEHNAFEHLIVPMNVRCGNVGTGTFTIYGSSDFRLTGTFAVRWVWST